MREAIDILNKLKAGQYSPVYLLQGEEPYYIDQISDFIEQNALDEASRGFNQVVLYGKDVKVSDVLNNAKRFPMMSDRQVVIVKEAQSMSDLMRGDGEKLLIPYLENPLASTILVFCYKYKKIDRRKSIYKAFDKYAITLTSSKIYDNQIPEWIREFIKDRGFTISDKAVHMMAESIGNNLQRLSNEIDKLLINFEDKIEINDGHVHKYIGISKEYNAFELQKAIAVRDRVKATKMALYFEANPKSNPVIPMISILYLFFSKLLILHGSGNNTESTIASKLKINRFFAKEYATATRNYPLPKVMSIIGDLRHADLQSKGINAANLPDGQILKELIFKILH